MSEELLLDIRNLNVSFHRDIETIHAVNNINFFLRKGETLGIVGESGSGKSVTALSIMRLLSPNGKMSGDIFFNALQQSSENLSALSQDEMRRYRGKKIAMIFQEPMTSLNPVLSCGYQVAESVITHLQMNRPEAREYTLKIFEKVELPCPQNIYDAYPHQLSGGQKQRIMIAMAISANPSLLIADEPTTALDSTLQFSILRLIKELQQETGMGLLFITHDLGVVANMADRIAVMYKGKIIEEGFVNVIFNKPEHPYTKGLIACRPVLNKRLKRLPTIQDFMKDHDGLITEIKSSALSDNIITDDEKRSSQQKLYSQKSILEVKDVIVHFPVRKGIFGKVTGIIKAVDDVSFEVYPGETLGLVGESGCGKSTLSRTIMQLIGPSKGKIFFKGKDIYTMLGNERKKMRRNMQIIFQDPYSSLDPRMTAGESILEPMKVHGIFPGNKKQKVIEWLERVNLSETIFHRYPHELSGGQRQRVCIARALVLQPELVLCDECVSSLDVSIQAQILNLLNELKHDLKFTSIFISHDLSVVKFMCDRMLVMNSGKIEESGDPDVIYARPASPYTQKLISAIPVFKTKEII
jgi:peptide/nickel transport system ATP-binding protein